MSKLRVDEITNEAGTGAPSFPNGASGVAPPIASTGQAEAGTSNDTFITPLRMREGFNATGSAPVYACRAWVNFDGTGTVSIRASGNVSSITDNGTGNYTVNFTTAMQDADYAAVTYNNASSVTTAGSFFNQFGADAGDRTVNSITVSSFDGSAFQDSALFDVIIFR